VSFGADLLRIAKARSLSLEKVSRGVTLRLFNAVARDTRVDTGRLRGNWQVTQDAPAGGEVDRFALTGGLPESEAGKIQTFAMNILANHLPYAPVWEESDGMISGAIADFDRIVREEVAKEK
jgi:hypothetical protein